MRSNEQIKDLALGKRRDLPSSVCNGEAKDTDTDSCSLKGDDGSVCKFLFFFSFLFSSFFLSFLFLFIFSVKYKSQSSRYMKRNKEIMVV